MLRKPLNFNQWIKDNQELLKPPVGNRQIWEDTDFWITVVGGPNARSDYHVNEGEEFFYQIKGDMNLRLWEEGKPRDFKIAEGEIFLLPPLVPHSPQRPEGSIGLVIEHKRLPQQKDSLIWFCEECHEKLYEEKFHLTNIVSQFGPVFDRFFSDTKNSTCKKCGWQAKRKTAKS